MANRGVDTYGDAYAMYVPGLFVSMGLFGGLFAGYGLFDRGAPRRHRPLPRHARQPHRAAARPGADARGTAAEFQATMITIVALPFGLRVGPGDLLVAYALLSLVILLSISISYGIALVVRNENSLSILINTVGQPVSLLAGVLIPLTLAPLWVQNVALWNPFAWATDGLRALLTGHLATSAVWQGWVVMILACALSVGWSIRQFNREVS